SGLRFGYQIWVFGKKQDDRTLVFAFIVRNAFAFFVRRFTGMTRTLVFAIYLTLSRFSCAAS
ncbi:hypothetical protein ABLN85_05665, partial [Mycobacterium tuberculosis]